MEKLYFIALLPPVPLRDRIHQLKLQIKEQFHSSHSLNAPPHITLVRPFHLEEQREEELVSDLKGGVTGWQPFEVQLRDFSTFSQGVLFVDVEKTQNLLDLQEQLDELVASNPETSIGRSKRTFNPHLTVASKDFSRSDFLRARDHFADQAFEEMFEADAIALLRHDGKRWEIEREVSFQIYSH